jgi:Tat protein translocase TatC
MELSLSILAYGSGCGIGISGKRVGNMGARKSYVLVREAGSEFASRVRTEVRIRAVRILIGLGFTWFTCYWFPEELISPLAIPFLDLPLDSYFVRTQSTEALSTYVATSSIACSIFVFALIIHLIGCFSLPSCYGTTGAKYIRFFHLSGSRCSLFLFLTPNRVVPNVWDFLYFMGATSTKSLMIKLQPKIYDHIQLTVRISFIPSVCSLVPVIWISLPENREAISVETSSNNRRFVVLVSLLTAALSTPPDIWCQILACFIIIIQIEFAIFVASIVHFGKVCYHESSHE